MKSLTSPGFRSIVAVFGSVVLVALCLLILLILLARSSSARCTIDEPFEMSSCDAISATPFVIVVAAAGGGGGSRHNRMLDARTSPQPAALLTPVDASGEEGYARAIANVRRLYDAIPELDNLPADPVDLPVVDMYESKRGFGLTNVVVGRWFVAFNGPRMGETVTLSECSVTVKMPSRADLEERVRLLDLAADVFTRSLKLGFFDTKVDRKFYLYMLGSDMTVPADRCGGSPDGNLGFTGVPTNWGAIIHELGHAMFPRLDMADWKNAFNDDYEAGGGPFSPVMAGETFANMFGWYVHLLMMSIEPDHPYWTTKRSVETAYMDSLAIPMGRIASWFINSHVPFDAGLYTRFTNPTLVKLVEDLHAAKARDRFNSFPAKLALIEGIERVYGSRYENGFFLYYFYLKYGIESIVAYYYHVLKIKDVVDTMAFVVGIDTPSFLQAYVLDMITHAYFEGDYKDQRNRRIKTPYAYSLQAAGQYAKRRNTEPMEYKGFDVYDVRSYAKTKKITKADRLTVSWTVPDPENWRAVLFNGYGRNGYFEIDGKTAFLPMDAGTSTFADGRAGSIVLETPDPAPIFFAIIAAVRGVDTRSRPRIAVDVVAR